MHMLCVCGVHTLACVSVYQRMQVQISGLNICICLYARIRLYTLQKERGDTQVWGWTKYVMVDNYSKQGPGYDLMEAS